jgi:hypothetical protein
MISGQAYIIDGDTLAIGETKIRLQGGGDRPSAELRQPTAFMSKDPHFNETSNQARAEFGR